MEKPQPSFLKRHWKLLLGGFIVLAIIGGIIQKKEDDEKKKAATQSGTAATSTSTPSSSSSASTATATPTAPSVMQVSARDLFAAYESNEVAADEKYKGKTLEVQGTVSTIGKDIIDTMYVTLDSGKPYSLMSVQCMFGDDQKSRLTQLQKGQKVTIRGRCDGKFGNVVLKDSSIQ